MVPHFLYMHQTENDSANEGQQRSQCITWFCGGADGGAYASKMDRSWEATFAAPGVGAVNPAAVNGLPNYSSETEPEGNQMLP